ncbi:MAG: NAD(P)-dependent alcohol dehydrogenase [Caldilineaceae bacterium]
MKAIVFHQYGSPAVLNVERVPKPVPNDNEILVKVHATSANAGDWHLMRGDPFLIRLGAGLRKPKSKFLGADVAGQVEAVGSNVTQFQPGDEVFGDLARYGFGAFAEYVAAPEDAFVLKPANLTFAQAAAVPEAGGDRLQSCAIMGKSSQGRRC